MGGGGDIGRHQRGEEAYGEYSGEDDGIAQREMCGLTSLDGRKGGFIDLFMFFNFFFRPRLRAICHLGTHQSEWKKKI